LRKALIGLQNGFAPQRTTPPVNTTPGGGFVRPAEAGNAVSGGFKILKVSPPNGK